MQFTRKKSILLIIIYLVFSNLQAESVTDEKKFKMPFPLMMDISVGQGKPGGDFEKSINGNANGVYASNLTWAKTSPEGAYLGYSYLTKDTALTSKNFTFSVKGFLLDIFHLGFSYNFMQIDISEFTPYPFGFKFLNARALFSKESSPPLDYLILYRERKIIRHFNGFFDVGFHYKYKYFTPFITLGIDLGAVDISASQLSIGAWVKIYHGLQLNFQTYYLKSKIPSVYQYYEPNILLEAGMRIGISYLYE